MAGPQSHYSHYSPGVDTGLENGELGLKKFGNGESGAEKNENGEYGILKLGIQIGKEL